MNEPDHNTAINQVADWLDDASANASDSASVTTETADDIADTLVVHGLLTDLGTHRDDIHESRIQSVMQAIREDAPAMGTGPITRIKPRRRLAIAASLAFAAGVSILLLTQAPQTADAATTLDRLIQTAATLHDRTYAIHVLKRYSSEQVEESIAKHARPVRHIEEIDGAVLHVRGKNQYVFIRDIVSGGKRYSGSDGTQAWSFRDNGPIHVSSDPKRFGGRVPGSRHGFAFVNIHSHLEQLRQGFDLEVSTDANDPTLESLVGVRRSPDVHGVKRVEIEFTMSDGVVRTMRLFGLPRGKGGPKAVELTLQSTSDLATDFFTHQAHHDDDREIRNEDTP